MVLGRSFETDTTLIPMAQIKSVAFGLYTDTTIQFFSNADYHGLIQTVGVDMKEDLDIDGSGIGSIKIFDSKKNPDRQQSLPLLQPKRRRPVGKKPGRR